MLGRRGFLGRLAALAGALGFGCLLPKGEAAPKATAMPEADNGHTRLRYNGVEVDLCRTTMLATVAYLDEGFLTRVRHTLDVSGIVRLQPAQTADDVRAALSRPDGEVRYIYRGSREVRGASDSAPRVVVRPVVGDVLAQVDWAGEFVETV